MEMVDAYENSGSNWECAQLMPKYNSERDTEKQNRKYC